MTRKYRKQSGAALISVLVIGTTSIIFLLGLAAIVSSAVKVSAGNKWVEGLRNSAEIGIDYAVDQFNSVSPCPLDPDAPGVKISQLPPSELEAVQVNGVTPNSGVPNAKVTIKVTRLSDTQYGELAKFSSIYSPQLDPANSKSHGFTAPLSTNIDESTGGGFRVIESTATNGMLSRTIRVVIKARFDLPPDKTRPLETNGPSPVPQSYFKQPFFGNNNITINGVGTVVDGIDSLGSPTYNIDGDPAYNDYNLNLATNQLASIQNGAKVSGNVNVTSSQSGNDPVVRSTTNATVDGRVTANGQIDSNLSSWQDGGNVLAKADSPNATGADIIRLGANATDNPIAPASSGTQNQISPIATPSSALALAPLNTYSTSPTNDGTTFQTSSLSTDGVLPGKPVPFDNTGAPVQIFVNQGGTTDSAVNIDTSSIKLQDANQSGGKFQIWYEGNKPVTINMTNNGFNATIYAPNANIAFIGPGSFRGAVVGKSISMSSGKVTIETDLGKDSPKGSGTGPGALDSLSYRYRAGLGTVIQGWQPITWQEYGPGSGL